MPDRWIEAGLDQPPQIAIVEDDDDVRAALAALIDSIGCVGQTFASADAYLDHPPTTPPSCVITDMQMPGTSGLELAERLTPTLPVILVTGFPSPDLERRALSAGVSRLLRKPFSPGELIAAIRTILT